jgi:hypothetical protein
MSRSRSARLVGAGFVVTMLLASVFAPSAAAHESTMAPSAAPTEVPIQVLSYRLWKHENILRIVGEVRNTSPYRVDARVTVRIAPGHNTPNETLSGNVGLINLAPGGRAPFEVGRAPFAPSSTSIVEITAIGVVVPNPAAAIGLSAVSAVTSDPDLTAGTGDTVRVQVRNGTDRPVQMLTMVASFRGSDGKVSNIGGSFTNDIILAPGEVWEDWVASSSPSGILAVRADVDVWAYFLDGAQEPVVSWQNWFRDIDASSLRMSIAWLAEEGITAGCAPFRYCPSANVTRAQMAIFLDRAFDLPAAAGDHFSDDTGVTGEGSINALFEAGITGGCAPGKYCPLASVTRAQMALFLDRVLDLPTTSTDFFTDDEGVTGEAAINRLAAAGITGGCGGTKYCPGKAVTRAQMAGFLRRALE